MDTIQAKDPLANGHKFSRLKTTIKSVLRVADNCGHVSLGSGRPINWLKKRTKYSVNKTPPFLCIRLLLESLTIFSYIALDVMKPKTWQGSLVPVRTRDPGSQETLKVPLNTLHTYTPAPKKTPLPHFPPFFPFTVYFFPSLPCAIFLKFLSSQLYLNSLYFTWG